MRNIPPIVALEIGTTKVRVLVGETREDGQLMITGLGEIPSRGVRKSEIVDIDIALASVRSALELAEESGPVSIHQVHLLLSGGHLECMVNRGSAPVLDESGEIAYEDIDHCMDTARAVSLPAERVPVHTICQRFDIDDHHTVVSPVGMEGSKLSVDMLLLHGVRGRLRNTVKVARSVPVEVHDVAFGGLCAGLGVLTPEQKEKGVLLVDLGGGTTDYVVYARNAIAWAGSIAVGGDHITNDVARGLRIASGQAEQLKESFGDALVDFTVRSQKIAVPAVVGAPDHFVSLYDLHTIIHLRMEETLEMIKAKLERQDLLHLLGSSAVLVGGGSYLKNVDILAQKVFGMPCIIGKPFNVSGLATVTDGPQYAAPVGMLRYGVSTHEKEAEGGVLKNMLRTIFRK